MQALVPSKCSQTDDAVIAEAELPGADPRQVEVTLTENSVTLRGSLREEGERREGGYLYRERRQGSFHRQLPLPVSVQAEAAKASYQHGILRVVMPKSEEARRRARRVPIEGPEQG
jgi:HSP20 family protein